MKQASKWTVPALLALTFPLQAAPFTFDGVGLGSDFKAVAARYSHSMPQDQMVSLVPEDVHDHISHIEISGSGRSRRVRIGFETRKGDRPDYPACAEVEAKLVARYGKPQTIHRFMEEASPRADRIWQSSAEELTLICFTHPGKRAVLAEAVMITNR